MPEPISYIAVQNLQTAIRAISTGAGYFYTVAATAVKLDPNQNVEALVAPSGPRPFVIFEVNPERWVMAEKPNGLRNILPVTVHWVHTSDPATDDDLLRTYLRGCADIEKAIAPDPSRGGYAQDTLIVNCTFNRDGDDGSRVWAMVDVELVIRRTFGTPSA